MLEDPQVINLMKQVAAGIFPAKELLDVQSEPSSDQDGKDALRITLVLSDLVASQLTGEQLTNLMREIHDSLLEKGDDRFPHLYFRTPTDCGVDEDQD